MQDAYKPGVLDGHECHTPKSCCSLRFTLLISRKSEKSYADPSLFCASFTAAVPSTIITKRLYYVQLLQNREYLQYGLSNGKHRYNH